MQNPKQKRTAHIDARPDGLSNGATRLICSMILFVCAGFVGTLSSPAHAQMIDATQAPNNAKDGINKSLTQEIGAGRGSTTTPDSSLFITARDPFRAVRRGRQLFQRKFTRVQGQGPGTGDGSGDINVNIGIGAGLSDSCGGCHGRPRGSAGTGGDVVTRPDSRDAVHLFGLGVREMLADEITTDLRSIRSSAIALAVKTHHDVKRNLVSKGINYGSIRANPDGSVDTTQVEGVDPDLRVRPFFAHGGTISIREFVQGALKNEMGLESADPDTSRAVRGARVVTPAGMVLDGSLDTIEAPPIDNPTFDPNGNVSGAEIPTALLDYFEFYLLNYFTPAVYKQDNFTQRGLHEFNEAGCATCHVANFTIQHDRRVANLSTEFDPVRGIFNNLFATATPLNNSIDDGTGLPTLKPPKGGSFLVENLFTDFKRHDLGPNFHERNWDGTTQTMFMTRPLWGVGSKAAYGHDGRSANLTEVILRHGGEAQSSRDAFANEDPEGQAAILAFLRTLILFPPDDTASTLDPGNKATPGFPQVGHGSIKLTVLFNDPTNKE